MGYDRHDYLDLDKCVYFDRELCFELGKCICRKHDSFYQDHMKYIRNDIVKPLRIRILRYSENVRDMHDLEKYPPHF